MRGAAGECAAKVRAGSGGTGDLDPRARAAHFHSRGRCRTSFERGEREEAAHERPELNELVLFSRGACVTARPIASALLGSLRRCSALARSVVSDRLGSAQIGLDRLRCERSSRFRRGRRKCRSPGRSAQPPKSRCPHGAGRLARAEELAARARSSAGANWRELALWLALGESCRELALVHGPPLASAAAPRIAASPSRARAPSSSGRPWHTYPRSWRRARSGPRVSASIGDRRSAIGNREPGRGRPGSGHRTAPPGRCERLTRRGGPEPLSLLAARRVDVRP